MRSFSPYNRKLLKRYDQWMIAMHYVPGTQRVYRRTLRKFAEFMGERSMVSASHWDIRQFMTRVSEDGSTLNATYRHLSVLRLFYDFLNLGGLVSYVPPRLVRLRRGPTNPGPMLTEFQIRRLIDATRTLRERALIEFFYGSGCRLCEAKTLTVECVDLIHRTARILGKLGMVRTVLLTKSAADALGAYIGDRRTGLVFQQDMPLQRGCVAKRGNRWVGLWTDYGEPGPRHPRKVKDLGRLDQIPYENARLEFETFLRGKNLVRPISTRPLSNMAVQHLVKLIGERAGLRNVGPHMLRRSFATHLYDHGAALEVVQALLGHRFLQTTLGYTRLSTGRLKKTFERCHPRRKMNECAPQHGDEASPQGGNVD